MNPSPKVSVGLQCSTPVCVFVGAPTRFYSGYSKPRNCQDIYLKGETKNGVYKIYVGYHSAEVKVYCDMDADGGGWQV